MATFDEQTVTAVLKHMNEDHAEDNLLIARAFGDLSADSSVMTGLDGSAGTWSYTVNGATQHLSAPWSTTISTRAEIRRAVVVLYNAACTKLGVAPRAQE